MKCINCGADFQTSDLKCPYCGMQNVIGEEWKKERNWHENRYQKIVEELKEYGIGYVLNKITNRALIILFIIFVVLMILYLVPAIFGDVSLIINRNLNQNAIGKQLQEYHESGQYDKVLEVVDEYDLYSTEEYSYTQAALLYRQYEDYLMHKMMFLDMSEEEKQADDYHLEYAIRDSRSAYLLECGIYDELDPANAKQYEMYQQEILEFWKGTLGLTEEELQYFMSDEYIAYDLDEYIIKIKERKAWQ